MDWDLRLPQAAIDIPNPRVEFLVEPVSHGEPALTKVAFAPTAATHCRIARVLLLGRHKAKHDRDILIAFAPKNCRSACVAPAPAYHRPFALHDTKWPSSVRSGSTRLGMGQCCTKPGQGPPQNDGNLVFTKGKTGPPLGKFVKRRLAKCDNYGGAKTSIQNHLPEPTLQMPTKGSGATIDALRMTESAKAKALRLALLAPEEAYTSCVPATMGSTPKQRPKRPAPPPHAPIQ